MGSGARGEQSLCTDQDNALLYETPATPEDEAARGDWFRRLGELVCGILADCGYQKCTGGYMASNPRWCQPLRDWQETFRRWIKTSDAEDLLHTKIFFDIRTVCGDDALLQELWGRLYRDLEHRPQFFFLLARNVLLFQPPLGPLGNFIPDPDVPERDVLNLKGIMALITDFSRIYALKHRLPAAGTLERLQLLREAGVLTAASHTEIAGIFRFLMALRLRRQAETFTAGGEIDNYVEPAALTSLEQVMLKEALSQIKHYQVKLSYDFTGSMGQAT